MTGASSSGGVWKWEDFSLDLNQIDNNLEIEYYPNPTYGIINFIYEGDLTILVYDMLGRKIIETDNKLVNLSDFNKGLYIFKITDKINQKSKSIRIIKK